MKRKAPKMPKHYNKLKQKKRFKGLMIRLFQFSVLGTIIFILAGLVTALIYKEDMYAILDDVDNKIENIKEETFKNKVETVVYDNNGDVITKIAARDYYYLDFENIPKDVLDATIAIEDIRFFEHKGYDLKAIGRAGVELIKNKGTIKQGGSTLTQQLVKLEFLTLDQTYKRKVSEILIAAELEEKFSKEQILEFYLNNINYGNGAYGIETASKKYFNKPTNELTLSEVAFLVAIPNNPSKYNPVRFKENTLNRRDLILAKMNEYGMIDQQQYMGALSQVITLNMPEKEMTPETFETSFALSSATKIIMEQEGFEFKYWFDSAKEREAYAEAHNERFVELNQKIRNGGYEIHTTIDMEKQRLLQESVNKELSGYKTKNPETGLYEMQGSAVTIDNETGDVVAIIGGRTQQNVHNSFNRAFLSHRQPGSIIKPLIVYTPAFQGGMLSSTVMNDKKEENGPENATGRYLGNMSLREAIARSVNTIPHQIGEEIGSLKMLAYLREMEFTRLMPKDNQVGIAYGGFTYGSNTLEMASAYATLANDGQFIKPTGISKIIDVVKMEAIYENERKSKEIYDSGAANLMLDTMQDVVKKRYGTANGFGLNGMPTAAKTGTTNSYFDKWFAGITPYYTTVVWVGYDTPKSLGQKADPSRHIWKRYSEQIHKGLAPIGFSQNRVSMMYKNRKTEEVAKEPKVGWVQELVPELYFEKQVKRQVVAEKKRLKLAKQEGEKREQVRLAELASHGLTDEQMNVLQNDLKKSLQNLSYLEIKKDEDVNKATRFLAIAKENWAGIPIDSYREKYATDYRKQVNRVKALKRDYIAAKNPKKTQTVATKSSSSTAKNTSAGTTKYKPTTSKYQANQKKQAAQRPTQMNPTVQKPNFDETKPGVEEPKVEEKPIVKEDAAVENQTVETPSEEIENENSSIQDIWNDRR